MELTDVQQEGIVSSAIAGAVVGSAMYCLLFMLAFLLITQNVCSGGFLSDRLGRKFAVYLACVLFTAGALIPLSQSSC